MLYFIKYFGASSNNCQARVPALDYFALTLYNYMMYNILELRLQLGALASYIMFPWRQKVNKLVSSLYELAEYVFHYTVGPRFTGRISFPGRYRKLTVFHPDIPGTPIYRAKPFPPSIPVNRGPTVYSNEQVTDRFGL